MLASTGDGAVVVAVGVDDDDGLGTVLLAVVVGTGDGVA